VLVASAGTVGRAQRAPAVDDVRRALDRGAYDEAERTAVDVSAVVREQHGAESLESAQAQDLLVEALLKNGHAGADSTLELANRFIELKEQLRGPDDLETALSLHNLGDVRNGRARLPRSFTNEGSPSDSSGFRRTMPPSPTFSSPRIRAVGGRTTSARQGADDRSRSAHRLRWSCWLAEPVQHYAAAERGQNALASTAVAPQHPR
jgi:hypothetical protein